MRVDIANLWRALNRVSKEALAAGREGCYFAAVASRGPIQQTINATRPYPPVDTGVYRNAWRAIRTAEGAELDNSVPYAGAIEVGRPPHVPNEQAILEWARRKVRRAERGLKRGRARSKAERAWRAAQREAEAQELAERAMRSLSKYGMKPRNILLRTKPKMELLLARELERAARRFERANKSPRPPR